MRDILSRIIADKREEVEVLKRRVSLDSFRDDLPTGKAGAFQAVLQSPGPNIIAEIKQASPSRGIIAEDFDPAGLARQYAEGGAAALSVLTEKKYFKGHPDHLTQAKEASGLPVLCKDFFIDTYQAYYARRIGADAILLIARALTRNSLSEFLSLANELGLDCLVEVHNADELEMAVTAGANIIGVNNRDLQSFTVDLGVAERLARQLPAGVTPVAESGIFVREDVVRLEKAGYHAFLIGEALVRSEDPAKLIRELRGA